MSLAVAWIGSGLLAGTMMLGLVATGWAQDLPVPGSASPAAGSDPAAEPPPAPRRKPKPKPKPRTAPKAATEPKPDASTSAPQRAESQPPAAPDHPPQPRTGEASAPSPSQGAFATAGIACEPGQSVHYDEPNGFSLWVTRKGKVSIDNPLLPLTPDVTYVLRVVIGDKVATAYGRDLSTLRRGASPSSLQTLLGGPIHWEADPNGLPDSLDIVSDTDKPIAKLQFKECGSAPAAKESVEASKKPAKKRIGPRTPNQAPAGSPAAKPSPGGRALPQGAIPE